MTLFEMLSGNPPFVGEGNGEVIGMHLFREPPKLHERAPEIPEPVAALVQSLLAKERSLRPTMPQLAESLEQLLQTFGAPGHSGTLYRQALANAGSQRAVPSSPSTLGSAASQSGQLLRAQRRRLVAGVASFGLLLSVGAGIALLKGRKAPAAPGGLPPAAAAPNEQPRPEPAPSPSPKRIRIRITSDPSGADVLLQDGTLIGKTPLVHEREPTPGSARVTLRLPGHAPAHADLETDTSGQIEKRLVPLAPRPAPSAPVSQRPRLTTRPSAPSTAPAAAGKPASSRQQPAASAPVRRSLRDVIEK